VVQKAEEYLREGTTTLRGLKKSTTTTKIFNLIAH